MRHSSIAILLLNDQCRVVACSYDKDDKGKGAAPFTLFKTFRTDLAVGDIVVVPTNTRHGFTSVRIEELDAEWSPDDSRTIDWLVGKVDTAEYEKLKAEEAKGLEILSAAEKRAKRKEMTAKLTEHLDETEKAALQLTSQATASAGT